MSGRWLGALVVLLHGLVHLLGLAAYLRLAEVATLPYKTTVLAGWLDLGSTGTAVFGALWGLVALGLVVAALALLSRQTWWVALLYIVTLASLALTVLDWPVAGAGIAVNLAILLVLAFWQQRQGQQPQRPTTA
jgi:hypothetical protein